MPTEGFEKGKIYFKSKDDEEYKELGILAEPVNIEVEEKNKREWEKLEKLYDNTGFTAKAEIKLKKYSKKRFKKLLMARGIQRNDAEIFATISGDRKSLITRDGLGLIIAKIMSTTGVF